jgi:hypothetical protein
MNWKVIKTKLEYNKALKRYKAENGRKGIEGERPGSSNRVKRACFLDSFGAEGAYSKNGPKIKRLF